MSSESDMMDQEYYPDCGSNSCQCIPPDKGGGMRVDGGCTCLAEMNRGAIRREAHRIIDYWRNRALKAEEKYEQAGYDMCAETDGYAELDEG